MIIETIDSITIEKPQDVSMEQKGYYVDYKDSKGFKIRQKFKPTYLIIKGKTSEEKSFEYRIATPYIAQIKVEEKPYMEYKVGTADELGNIIDEIRRR